MKRQTQTTLGKLRQGDRFYFFTDKQPVVREVTGFVLGAVKYNKINSRSGKHTRFWDRCQPNDRKVMFIRHTDLQPGDECFMYELKDGDVFTQMNSKKEMRRIKEMRDGQIAVRYVGAVAWTHTAPLTTGIFVRRASLKTLPKDVQ